MVEVEVARSSGRDDLVRHEASQNFELARSGGGWMVAAAWVAAIVWLVAATGIFVGLDGQGFLQKSHPALAAAAVLSALLPAFLIVIAGYLGRTNRRAAAANALVLEAATRLLAPAREAGTEGISLAESVKQSTSEIDRAMTQALASMQAMSGEIGDERLRLESVSYATADNARELATRLSAERHALEGLARELRAQISMLTDAIPRQAQLMISAARQASEEVARAETGLEQRLIAMQEAGKVLTDRLGSLDMIARDAAGRTDTLTLSISRMEDKLEQSRRTVDAAVRAGEMAAAAAASTGDALRNAVSSALDGARQASAEINMATRTAAEEAARALARLREAGEMAAYALREASYAARSEADLLDHRAAGARGQLGASPATGAAPKASLPLNGHTPHGNGNGALPHGAGLNSGGQNAARGVDEDLFGASVDALIAAASQTNGRVNGYANGHHLNGHHVNGHSLNGHHVNGHGVSKGDAPLILGEDPLGGGAPLMLRNTSSPETAASAVPRRRASDAPGAPSRRDAHDLFGSGREALTAIGRLDPPIPADREAVATALIERLQSSGIPLNDAFKPKSKRRIAEASLKGDEERRSAILEQAGRQADRVRQRLRGDPRLMELARQFAMLERVDALEALQQTQSTTRNASPRLAAFLLVDAAV